MKTEFRKNEIYEKYSIGDNINDYFGSDLYK